MSDSTAFVQERMRISTRFFLFEYIALKFCWWSWRKTASELYGWHFLSEMAHTSVNYNELWMLQQFLRFLPPNKIFHSYFPNQKNLWYFQTPDKAFVTQCSGIRAHSGQSQYCWHTSCMISLCCTPCWHHRNQNGCTKRENRHCFLLFWGGC